MWDRLLVDCNIATLEGGGPGVVENGAIGIADGKIVRVGKRTELAGFRAKEVVALGGAWVTPGLVDCHTHLVFGGTRADVEQGVFKVDIAARARATRRSRRPAAGSRRPSPGPPPRRTTNWLRKAGAACRR